MSKCCLVGVGGRWRRSGGNENGLRTRKRGRRNKYASKVSSRFIQAISNKTNDIIVSDLGWKLNDNYHIYVQMKSGGKLRTLSDDGARTKRSSGSCWRKKSGVPSPGISGWRRRRRTDATKRKSTR